MQPLATGTPKPDCAPRVLVVEDEEQPRNDHVENLRRWGYIPIIAEGAGSELLDDAVRKARDHRCHVALVDMRLAMSSLDDESGLELVPLLKPTISIIVSGHGDTRSATKALREKGAFDFVSKGEGPKRLEEVLTEAINQACACYRSLRIEWPSGLNSAKLCKRFFPNDTAVPSDEVNDVLGRLFPDAHTIVIESISGASRTPSLAPRSRAVILKVSEPNREPVAVKIAPAERIGDEVARYTNFIAGRLVGDFAASLARHHMLWDLGGAVYKFIGSSDRVVTFTTYYASHPAGQIQRTLKLLFGRTWSRLYSDRRRQAGSLFIEHSCVWGESWHGRLRRYVPSPPPLVAPGAPPDLPNPITWLRRRVGLEGAGGDASVFPEICLAVTHGDMQGDNVFVGEFGEPWVIDHERTGFGPILQDFTELEVDILTRLATFGPDDLAEYYRLVAALVAPKAIAAPRLETTNAEATKALKVIRCLRRLAIEQTGIQDMRQYLWGLLLNAVFRATLLLKQEQLDPNDSDQQHERARTMLLGSVICRRLDRWDAPWPQVVRPSVRAAPTKGQASRSGAVSSHGYALLIGVGATLHEPRWSLPATAHDAAAIRDTLIDPSRCAYRPEQVRLLHNASASLERIRAGLRWLAGRTAAEPETTVVIFFSGHGWRDERGHYALVPADVEPARMAETLLWGEELTELIRAIPARRVLVLIDACHAGGVASAKGDASPTAAGYGKAPPSAELLRALQQGEGRVVISSSRDRQFSYFHPDSQLSLFTFHVIEALCGAGNRPGDAAVRVSNLVNHVASAVPASARSAWQIEQTPWIDQASEDFAIAMLPASVAPASAKAGSYATAPLAAIHTLLDRALSDEDIMDLCQHSFPAVYHELTAEMSTRVKLRRLLGYCERYILLDELLRHVQQINPAQYARFEAEAHQHE